MKVYQLSKIQGHYYWTGTLNKDIVPDDTIDYRYVSSKEEAIRLSNQKTK